MDPEILYLHFEFLSMCVCAAKSEKFYLHLIVDCFCPISFVAVCSPPICNVNSIAIFHEVSSENLKIAFRLYRGPLLIIEFIFLIGVNVYGWRSSGVNHVLIFELDPRNHLSEQHLMELAAIFGVVWTLSILSFLYSSSLSIPPFINPLALTIIMVLFMVNPLRVMRHDARFWLLRITVNDALMILLAILLIDITDFTIG